MPIHANSEKRDFCEIYTLFQKKKNKKVQHSIHTISQQYRKILLLPKNSRQTNNEFCLVTRVGSPGDWTGPDEGL